MSAITANGAVLSIGSTDVSDDTVRVTISPEQSLPVVSTFGGSRSAVGSTTWSGEIQVVYEPTTTLTQHPYNILANEADTPTSGGITITYQPGGASITPPFEEWVAVINVGQPSATESDAESDDVNLRVFPFACNGTPTRQAQT